MAEQKQGAEEEDEYDGPWIEKTLEWKCPDRKRHNVVLFGSWNRFKGGDELDYQGKQIFSCNVKLPLGTYVYRFRIDGEDWETHNNAPKTAKNGTEYNQVHIAEDDDEEEDDFAENDDDEVDDDDNTTVTFADGKLTMGKKRRGRPSVELDLGQDFTAEGDEEENEENETDAPDEAEEGDEANGDDESETTAGSSDATPDGTGAGTAKGQSAKGKRKHGKKGRKKKRGKRKNKQKAGKEDKEWAKYVFVQQLRLQQQHNDEINRVKTLWKQERQVRVEMHKKVVKQMKEFKKSAEEQKIEIERLQKTDNVTKKHDEKMSEVNKEQLLKLQEERTKLQGKVKEEKRKYTELRQSKVADEQQSRQSKGEWESKERDFKQQLNGLKSQIETLKQTQLTLESNLGTLKDGSTKTMELKSQQFAEREKQWQNERKELENHKAELKKNKARTNELEAELEEARTETSAERKKVTSERSATESAATKIKSLEADVARLKNSTEAAELMEKEINKVRAEKESECAVLSQKISDKENAMSEQKVFYDAKLKEQSEANATELSAMQQGSDDKMNEVVEALKAQNAQKSSELLSKQEEIAALQGACNEEKVNNDGLTNKLSAAEEECKTESAAKVAVQKEFESLKVSSAQMSDELKALQTSSANAYEEKMDRIAKLVSEVESVKASQAEEAKVSETRKEALEQQVSELQESINGKNESEAALTQSLTERQQEIEAYRNNEAALGSEVSSLKEQLSASVSQLTEKEKAFQESMDTLQSDMEAQIQAKDSKIAEVGETLNAKDAELTSKMSQFADVEKQIAEMEVNLEAERQNLENEKKNNAAAVAGYIAKENRIHECCKNLNKKFSEIKDEMKSVKEEQITCIEAVSKHFNEFDPLLSKLFSFNQSLVDDLLTKYKRELSLRRKYFNMVQDLRGNIRVFCRFRPLLPFELNRKDPYTECVKFPHGGAVNIVDDKGKTLKFEFDQVYNPKTDQAQVSEDATEYIQSVMDGYNVSIFAYGQTGSGKTYTMNGPKDNPGVNLRALKSLFKITEERSPQFQYKIKVSVFEIYNEKIVDLIIGAEEKLADLKGGKKKKKKKEKKPTKKEKGKGFKIRHLPDGSVEVEGLTKVAVESDADINELNRLAGKNRSASATDMNAQSSRSHMLLVVYVSGINIPANIKYFGKLYLVDLAGSERVKKSNATGPALKEAQNINKSLSALGDVMQALQKKEKFIPYRNSTLTDLMANALGGNAKTIMFINACPASAHAFETVSSLKFARRVGKVELGAAKQSKK